MLANSHGFYAHNGTRTFYSVIDSEGEPPTSGLPALNYDLALEENLELVCPVEIGRKEQTVNTKQYDNII
jgi:hypothetical protein